MIKSLNFIRDNLKNIYSDREIYFLYKIFFEKKFYFSEIDILLKEKKNSLKNFEIFKKIIFRLKNHEPIEYIISEKEFYNLKFFVNGSVLIPRSETEELVDLIIENYKDISNLKILDIGTGSACISISLGKNLKNSEIFSWDISKNALKVAKKNAILNSVNIILEEKNIFQENPIFFKENFDIIVSNPPYVRNSEKKFMEKKVINFEPEIAIFVNEEDNDLIFYEKIISFSKIALKKNGKLFFEINEVFGKEICKLLEKEDFKNIILKKDIFNKDRIIFCKK